MVLGLLIFSSFISFGQTKEEIKKLLEYALQKDDSLQIVKKMNLEKDTIIQNRNEYIKKDSLLITKYQNDSIQNEGIKKQYKEIILNKNEEIDNIIEDNRKHINRLRWQLAGLVLLQILTTAALISLL